MSIRTSVAIGFLGILVLVGCNAHVASPLPSAVLAPNAVHRRAAWHPHNLYVVNSGRRHGVNGSISVYAPGSTSVLRSIYRGMNGPVALAFERNGALFVANRLVSNVTVYGRGGRLLRRIYNGIRNPAALAFDSSGNLYVANTAYFNGHHGSVTVYAPGGRSVLRTITRGIRSPDAMAFDSTGNLYVANNGGGVYSSVSVYAPSSTSVLRTIHRGISEPRALAFDFLGNLYVGNLYGYSSSGSGYATVTVYAPGSRSPAYRILPDGVPWALALDSARNLYVLNGNCWNSINVYAPGGAPLQTIQSGLNCPLALAFDSADNLYVVNIGGFGARDGNVTVYAPGTTSVLRTISSGIFSPITLGFGP